MALARRFFERQRLLEVGRRKIQLERKMPVRDNHFGIRQAPALVVGEQVHSGEEGLLIQLADQFAENAPGSLRAFGHAQLGDKPARGRGGIGRGRRGRPRGKLGEERFGGDVCAGRFIG